MKYRYKTQGTCSRSIDIEVENGKIKDVQFDGGCNGNLKGISRLVKGMELEQVIDAFNGVTCGMRPTSCPDQLAKALLEIKQKAN